MLLFNRTKWKQKNKKERKKKHANLNLCFNTKCLQCVLVAQMMCGLWSRFLLFYLPQRGTGLYITESCFASTIRREIAIQRICMCYIQLKLETRTSKQWIIGKNGILWSKCQEFIDWIHNFTAHASFIHPRTNGLYA